MFKNISITLIILVSFLIGHSQTQSDSTNQTDGKGRKIGYWKKYNENGLLLYEGNFDYDIPVGNFTYYYPDEVIKAKSIFSDNGTKAATTTFHHNENKMSDGFYLNKQKDSLWKYYNIDEILLKEEYYKDNMKQGAWKVYFEKGNVAEITNWKNDLQEGPWQQFFPDGAMKVDGNFLKGEKQGEVKYYFSSGMINISGSYNMSSRIGTWLYYDETGKVIKKEVYEEGKLISEEDF